MFDSTRSACPAPRCGRIGAGLLLLAGLATALSALGCATTSGGGDAPPDARVKDPGPGPDASPGPSPYGVDLYLRGSFNDFGLSHRMTYAGQNRYTAELSLSAGSHQFKIADADFSDDTTFALDSAQAGAIQLDMPSPLEAAIGLDNNVLLFVPQTGTYRFELSAVDRSAPLLLVSLVAPAPYAATLYLRGSFNDFDTSTPLAYLGEGRYRATTVLTVGSYEFKIADASFSDGTTFTLDPGGSNAIQLGAPAPLVSAPGDDNNIALEVAETGLFEFTLSADVPSEPSLLVAQIDVAPYPETLYLRGSFNGFDTSTELRYRGDGRYVGEVLLDAGTHAFKVADEAFSDGRTFSLDPGDDPAIELDRAVALVPAAQGDPDATIEITQPAVYEFELDGVNPDAPSLVARVGTPAPYANSLFLQGSFNGFQAVDRMAYLGEGRYELVIDLSADTHQFKIADAGFSAESTFSVDATSAAAIQLDIPTKLELAAGEGNNTLLTIPAGSEYRFVLTADDPAAPVLLISEDLPSSTQ